MSVLLQTLTTATKYALIPVGAFSAAAVETLY